MTEPTMFTAQQAADPATPAQTLADIAALRADLRPLVAANPSAYPGLLEWLGALGEPAVDAALAERAAAEQTAPEAPATPTAWAPTAPSSVPHQPSDPLQDPLAQPWHGQPAQPWQGQQGQPAQPWQQGQPVQAWQGQQGQPAQPWAGQPYAFAPVPARPSKNGRTALIIVGAVLGVLLLFGVGVYFALKSVVAQAGDVFGSTAPTSISSGERYGDDPALDVLYDSCKGGDMTACDDLYDQSPAGSEYEYFADTCGDRRPTGTGLYCTEN